MNLAVLPKPLRSVLALIYVLAVPFGASLLSSCSMHSQTDATSAQPRVDAPRFEVDPMWPKPLPNNWRIGMTIGVAVDANDNVYIVHRPDTLGAQEKLAAATPPIATCCKAAPPVLVFSPAGDLIASWGLAAGARSPDGYDWPLSNHGIHVDYKGNIWIGGNGVGDNHILKFTQSGKFLLQVGKPKASKGSSDTENFNRAAKLFVDEKTNELYVADGYGNKRVMVLDAVLAEPELTWLGTEREKVSYFTRHTRLQARELPHLTFGTSPSRRNVRSDPSGKLTVTMKSSMRRSGPSTTCPVGNVTATVVTLRGAAPAPDAGGPPRPPPALPDTHMFCN